MPIVQPSPPRSPAPLSDVARYRALDGQVLALVHQQRMAAAARLLMESYGGEVLGACIGRLGDRAQGEDAAQDAMVRAVQALPSYRGTAGLRPWLHRIAANRCVDLLRTHKSLRQRVVDGYELEHLPGPEVELPRECAEAAREQAASVARVRAALARVKEPDRTWLELHYTHGVSYDDLAADAGLSRAAVKQRIWRAVKRVRALLAQPSAAGSAGASPGRPR